MNSSIGGVILAIGILALLFGVAAPSTTQQTSTTCYDDPAGYGQKCVQTTYEAPNTARSGFLGAGVFMLIVGGVIISSGGSSGHSPSQTSGNSSSQSSSIDSKPQTLAEKMQQRQENNKEENIVSESNEREEF